MASLVGLGGGGGGSAEGGGGVTSYIWHSTDVRAEWPPFSALPGIYDWPSFFDKKYMSDQILLD